MRAAALLGAGSPQGEAAWSRRNSGAEAGAAHPAAAKSVRSAAGTTTAPRIAGVEGAEEDVAEVPAELKSAREAAIQ